MVYIYHNILILGYDKFYDKNTALFYIFVCSLGLARVIVHSPVNSLSSVALNFTFWSACDQLRPYIQIVTTVDSLYLEHPLSRTSLYLEQFSLSLGHFHWFQPNFLSLSRTSISQTSLYLEQKFWFHANVSLPISNFSAFTQPVKAGFHSAHFPSGRAIFFLSAWNKEPIRNCYLKN